MEFTGRYVIPALPEAVWAGINDPAVLMACIPGCEKMEETAPGVFEASATLKVGPVRATIKGRINQVNALPPHSVTLKGEGQGGVAGFARGEADVQLAPQDGGTVLTYTARASIGGRLAQIGQRLIDGAARQIADDFFARFAAAIAVAPAPVEAPPEPEQFTPAPPLSLQQLAENRAGLAPEIWVVGLIAVILILLTLFGLVLSG